MNEQATRRQVRDFFRRRAEIWDRIYEGDSRLWRWFNRLFRRGIFLRAALALRAVQGNDCRSVLDVGCGSGRVSCLLAEGGVERVHGVDLAAPMIDLASRLASRRGLADACEFTVGDFREMELPGLYDAAIALGVFDYLPEPVPFLRKMRRHARTLVFFTVPSPTLVRSPLRKLRYALRRCPVFFYRRKKVASLLREAGFQHFDIHRATLDGYMVTGWVGAEGRPPRIR
jgi:SAM-dependent methyltransferase